MRSCRLQATGEFLVEFLKHDRPITLRVTRNALPSDARLVRMEADPELRMVHLVIESASFRDDDPDVLPTPRIELVD